MSSLRKRVSSYFRQLSFHNDPKENRNNVNENSFVTKYLQGRIAFKEGPTVLYGKNPTDLPNYDLDTYETGCKTIVGCYTGPNGGLTTVKRTEKHLSVTDPDIDYIDTQDESTSVEVPSVKSHVNVPVNNMTMVIKVAGQTYYVTDKKKQHNKSHSLGSLSDFNIDFDKAKINQGITTSTSTTTSASLNNNNNNNNNVKSNEPCIETDNKEDTEDDAKSFGLTKSKSEGNPFNHKKKGKIIKLTERPRVETTQDGDWTIQNDDSLLPEEWNVKSNYIYGLSDSLYDKNQVTKFKNGDPIADCFGVIARNDSAMLALADGVNWGEKACIAAKSAVHGCLHYLNKTIFNDTKPFQNLIKRQDSTQNLNDSNTSLTEHRINNTREVFVCLLRAFNCAHDLILENHGMLTTLTAAVVLPLNKSSNNKRLFEKYARNNENDDQVYVCCLCNVGDTLAYVYSQKNGIRELTKGSHDINSNRDMRDALGALGPVDGINPELSNLTLSITILQRGDIVLIASDGLTDNFDPNVCKFSTNLPESKKKTNVTAPQEKKETLEQKAKPPVKPPRKNIKPRSNLSHNVERTTTTTNLKDKNEDVSSNVNDALIEQFLQANPVKRNASKPSQSNKANTSQQHYKTRQQLQEQQKRPSTVQNVQIKSSTSKMPQRYTFLRSRTSLDMKTKPVLRNEDGIPYVTPIQRYELTLLLIEDILKRGISGNESQCVTSRKLCENLVSFTFSITSAKRRTLEDFDLYYDNRNGVLVEVNAQEKKMRRRRGLEKVQNLPGKLDHVSVVACNVGNFS